MPLYQKKTNFVAMKKSLLYSLLLSFSAFSFSQVDNEFWFAVPEVTSRHADKPVLLHVSSLNSATSVTISVPSNNDISPLTFTLEAQTTRSIDLIDEFAGLDLLENIDPDTISNKGLLIKSTNKISIYYEVLGTSSNGYGVVNTDIFTLKGSNALGKEFYTPFQTTYDNYTFGSEPDAWSSIDIVATQDNTKIIITPKTSVVDNPTNTAGNMPIKITLNKGQTFSVRNASQLAENSLSGSHIVADKPIAVTVKDDSVKDATGFSYDLIGDQLIPLRMLGTEYITGGGKLYITGTIDNTITTITYRNKSGGVSTIDTVIRQGATIAILNLADKPLDNSFHISTTEPCYTFVIKQLGSEYGGAVIPTITCTGSRRISVANSTEESLFIEVVTKSENENNFSINGNSFEFKNSDNLNKWHYGYATLNTEDFPKDEPIIVENSSGAFHLGVISGGTTTGARFGYFSNYSTLELGSNQSLCEGDTTYLDAGSGRDTYEWSQIGNAEFTSDNQIIEVQKTGQYIVEITEGICSAIDTITVNINTNLTPINIQGVTKFCENDSIVLTAPIDATEVLWQNNSTNNTFTVKETGEYKVFASNQFGCSGSDSIFIEKFPLPSISIPKNVSICEATAYTITLEDYYDTYRWSLDNMLIDENTNTYTFTEEGNYSVSVSNFCGTDSAFVNLEFWTIEIPNIITPNNDGKNDQFMIKGIDSGDWDLTIHNRWGKEVYRNTHFKNNWISTEKDGTYYYYLKHQDQCNDYKGWLYITGGN